MTGVRASGETIAFLEARESLTTRAAALAATDTAALDVPKAVGTYGMSLQGGVAEEELAPLTATIKGVNACTWRSHL